jgi:hypothetical protein
VSLHLAPIPPRKVVVQLHADHVVIQVRHPFYDRRDFIFRMPREQWQALCEAGVSTSQANGIPLYSGFEPHETANLSELC